MKSKRKFNLNSKLAALVSIFIILTTALFLSFVNSVSADEGNKTNSSLHTDYFNKVFDVTLDKGSGIFDKDEKIRNEYNNKIFSKKESKNLSLYDRFGGNIKFVPYYGEKKFTLSLPDTFYGNAKGNNENFDFKISDIWSDTEGTLQTKVYETRNDIVSEEDYKNDYYDPRRTAYQAISTTGGYASLGNTYLSMAEGIVKITGALCSNSIFDDISNIWDNIVSNKIIKVFMNMMMKLMPFFISIFVIMFIPKIIKAIKGNSPLKEVIFRFLGFLITIGVIMLFLTKPLAFKKITDFTIKSTDNIFSYALNIGEDEVVKSDDPTHIIEASIWRKAVFDPWCEGTFGKKYNQLYTTYSGKDKTKIMEQSNDDIKKDWKGKPRYNSVEAVGDVKVPLGGNGNYFTRNWAALAWSCQSSYHIDAVEESESSSKTAEEIEEKTKKDAETAWPRAQRCPNNPDIYVDNFRWLDAKLDISPKYINASEHEDNYDKAKPYTQNFLSKGMESFFLSLLLLPIAYVGLKRLIALVKILMLGAIWFGRSFIWLIRPDNNEYDFVSNFKSVFSPVWLYFWYSFTIYILIVLYKVIVGNILGDIIWIVLAMTIISNMESIDNNDKLNRSIGNIKRKAYDGFESLKKKVKGEPKSAF